MKQYQRKIEEYKSLIQKEYIRETAVHTVKERCSDILNRQDNRRASYFEFLSSSNLSKRDGGFCKEES